MSICSTPILQYSEQSPKAGLTGDLLDERRVRKEREVASGSIVVSRAPPLGGGIARDEEDGDETAPLLDELPGGVDRRQLGKSDKAPSGSGVTTIEKRAGGGKKKKKKEKKDDKPKKKKKRNGGKATRHKPRTRFAVTSSKAEKRP